MKRQLLAVAIAAATLLPLTAQAAPTVYGRLNLSVDYTDSDDTTNNAKDGIWELNSNSSRIGVKGNEKLTEEFTAVYKAEWGVQGDATVGDLNARERYLGLKHYQWGTVRLGNIDSPLKNAEDDIDVFNDMARLDMGKFIYGQNRLENSINYVSPKFLDVFGANISLQPGEKNGGADSSSLCTVPKTPTDPAYNPCENHIADAISAAFSYEDDNLYLSFAMDKEVADSATRKGSLGGNVDAMRLNARYKMGDATISAMYQMAEQSSLAAGATNEEEETAMMFSGSYKMDAITVRGEVLVANHDMGGGKEDDTTLIGVGVDYNFTQATKAFANLASGNMENSPSAAAKAAGAKSTDSDATYIGFGMETRF